ncbi:MAG: hypothetical protein WC093_04925 [Methanoculleus sp.]
MIEMANSRVKGVRPITLLFALTVLICVMLIAPAAAGGPQSSRVYVNTSYNEETPDYGYHNFSSIQLAVENVSEGGEVWVYNGTYNESVVIARSMNVTTVSHLVCPGLNGTILNAMGEDVGVLIAANGVSFSGFEVKNASAVGIHTCDVDTVTIEYNSIAVRNETNYEATYGIIVAGGEGACVSNNKVRVIGSSALGGIMAYEVTEACIHDNHVVAVARHQIPEAVGMEPNPVTAAFVIENEEPSITVEVGALRAQSGGVLVAGSSSVVVERNRIVAVGNCTEDALVPHSSAVEAWGIWSGQTDRLSILENNVTVVGKAADVAWTVGILGNGELALVQNNTVEVIAESRVVQPVGIVLDRASKGQVLDNEVEMEAECLGTAGEDWTESAGIVAVESYNAQVTGNDIHYTLLAAGPGNLAMAEIEGIDIVECDESRVSENIVIIHTGIFSLPVNGDEPAEDEGSLALRVGRVKGIDVEESDEPEICDNVVHAFGTVMAFDEKAAGDLNTGSLSALVLTGIHVWGDYDDLLVNPVVHENVVVVMAQTSSLPGQESYEEGVEAALAGNDALLARYTGMMQENEEEFSVAACLADAEGLPALTGSDLEFEPDIDEATLAAALTVTAGVVLEDVLNPEVCCNYIPVYQDVAIIAIDLPVSDEMLTAPLSLGLIDQVFSDEQVRQAVLLGLIDENDSEWQNLSEEDRAAITDAVLAGDTGILAAYTEGETLTRYQALIEDGEAFDFLSGTRLTAAIPISVSCGVYVRDAEGDVVAHDNEIVVETSAAGIAYAAGDELNAPDAAAGSAGLVAAFGFAGEGDSITVEENCIHVTTNGAFMSGAFGGANETADAAAGTANLLLAVGVSAAADDECVVNNNITVAQGSQAHAQALNMVKDRTALSVAAAAGVGVGIILDADEVFDLDTYEPALPTPDEEFPDVIQGNNISVTTEIGALSFAEMQLPLPLDGSSHALSGAAGAAASFGIVAPEAEVLDNVVNTTASQMSVAEAFVLEVPSRAVQAADIDLPGAGAANLGVAVSGGILTLRSYIEGNTVNTLASSEVIVEAETEELLEDAAVYAGTVVADVGIVSLSPSYIDGNTVDGEIFGSMIGTAGGDRVDTGFLVLALDLGILSRGSDATFNNIHNGYLGFPYYYEEEEYEPYAFYNWWGDASGPSELGPGTGSPVIGTMNYEPWLTQPADIVLETGKSYFGLEIGSPNIGGDGYREGLAPGWNTLSFPMALENNTWQAVTHSGDGLNYSVACTWDAANQRWVQVTGASKINPLDAVYILMNDYDRLSVAISPEIMGPPTKDLKAGWNLVGPAYDLKNGPIEVPDNYLWWGEPYGTSLVKALASVEETIVVSPSINPEAWVYTVEDKKKNAPDMDATCGYWVFMENPDTLAGFSSTPLPMPGWAWDL